MQYPINIEAQSDLQFAREAATEAEAVAIVRAEMIEGGFEEDADMGELPTKAYLSDRQVSRAYKTREEAETVWALELKTGPYSLSQVYGGWIVNVESWITQA